MSRLSNFSRIWNMNTPKISTPTSTSSAIPNSTIIGMPLVTAVAAKIRPFSIDRKPITCGTALERVIIIKNESSTQASAIPSEPPAMDDDRREIGKARLKEKITSAIPTSMVVGMLIRVSTSQRTLSLRITRCSIQGIKMTLSSRVKTPEM